VLTTVLVLGGVAVAALLLIPKSRSTLVGGVFKRDRRGRMTFVLTPATRKKRRRRR
jgi:hypothetical protein